MITIKNYNDQKNSVNWSKMPKAVQDTRNDIEEIMEFYDDDAEIAETIDIFLKQINDNSKPVGEIIVAKVPKYDRAKIDNFKKENLLEIKDFKPKEKDIALFMHFDNWGRGIYKNGNKFFVDVDGVLHDMTKSGEPDTPFKNLEFVRKFKTPTKKETHPQPKFKVGDIVYYKQVGMIDKIKSKKLASGFDDDNDGSVKWFYELPKYGDIMAAEEMLQLATQAQIDSLKTAKAKAPAKVKTIKPTISKTFVDNFSIEFQLIRRFWNIVDDGVKVVPFRKVQLLFNAFNKAALERKIRKTNEVADLFTKCSGKITKLYNEFAAPGKSDVEAILTDQNLYEEIKKYCTNVAVNPAVSVLKRYIAVQNMKPDVKKVESIIKAIDKVLTSYTNNRLAKELSSAKENLQEYIDNPKEFIDVQQFGLSRPATKKVCKNRVKCSGLTPNGRLKKGYRFEEDTNNVIKVVKGLGSPKVCHNRVKCAGLTQNGQLRKGYKFREDTNEVIRVTKAPATRKPTAKKPVAKKKIVVGLGFSDNVERIYGNGPIIPITGQPEFQQIEAPAPVQEKISQPAPDQVQPPVVKNKLMNMQFDSLNMDEGWENFMQNPAKNMKMAIWGAPKNGKTAGSLQLANYLTKFGKVLYNFADQGFNKSTQDLWQMSGLANNPKAEPSDVQTLDELEKEVATGKYTFVFIDMISDYINKEGIKPYEFKERFMKKYPKVSFILIFEVTKGGNFKGDQGWTHIVDAIVTVEDFLMENRGRYGVGSHIVWEDGLKRFNPKRYTEVMEELSPTEFTEVERI